MGGDNGPFSYVPPVAALCGTTTTRIFIQTTLFMVLVLSKFVATTIATSLFILWLLLTF